MSSEAKAPSTPSPQQNESNQLPLYTPAGPRRGEIWDVNWSPGRGAEQQGTRPALIVQNDRGNTSHTYPLTIVAAISRTERHLPLHVRIAPTEENRMTDYTDVKCEQIMTIKKSHLLRRPAPLSSWGLTQAYILF